MCRRKEALFRYSQLDLIAVVSFHSAEQFGASAIQYSNRITSPNPQNPSGVMGFAAGQEKRRFLAFFRRKIEARHEVSSVRKRARFGRLAEGHWKRFLAFSKKLWLIGLSFPLQSSANSWSFAFCAADKCVGTSTLMRTCKSPKP